MADLQTVVSIVILVIKIVHSSPSIAIRNTFRKLQIFVRPSGGLFLKTVRHFHIGGKTDVKFEACLSFSNISFKIFTALSLLLVVILCLNLRQTGT